MTQTWLALHVRATGPNLERDAVTAVAAVRFDAGGERATLEQEVRSDVDRPAAWRTRALGSVATSEVPPIEAVLPRLAEFMGGATVVGLGAREQLAYLQRFGLSAIAAGRGLGRAGRHRAARVAALGRGHGV